MAKVAKWVAADWGTSNLRIWVLDDEGKVIIQRSSDDGMGGLGPSDFEPALLSLIDDILPRNAVTQVLVCGMAGAKQGWVEAPYAPVPCTPTGLSAVCAPTEDVRLKVDILPGLSQQNPFDVMRGEETQISGFLSLNKGFEGVLCLPGTHTKWVQLKREQVVKFQTVMTGETFALLSGQSVLRHSMPDESRDSWDQAAYLSGIDAARAHPTGLLSQLFKIRAAGLLSDQRPEQSKAHLSGLLIGSEMQSVKDYWLDKDVRIIGAPTLCDLYMSALTCLSAQASIADHDEDLALIGLKAAYSQMA